MIAVEALTREFSVTHREPGLRAALGSVVRRRYRTLTAVQDVSFHVEGGTVLGLLGPNGSGKTTTLKCVAGLLTPTTGRVEVLGHTPSQREPAFLRRLGFVIHAHGPPLPVLESRARRQMDRTAFLATSTNCWTFSTSGTGGQKAEARSRPDVSWRTRTSSCCWPRTRTAWWDSRES